MDDPSESSSPPPEPAEAAQPAASKWTLPRLPLLLGVVGLGALVATGVWTKRAGDARVLREIDAVRTQFEERMDAMGDYHRRVQDLRWTAAKFRLQAQTATAEPLKSWMRERVRLFDAFVAEVENTAGEAEFVAQAKRIEAMCRAGEPEAARALLRSLPKVKFPEEPEFRRLRGADYERPLAQFSRQNPAYYRVFNEQEPAAARADVASLREALEAHDPDALTPQAMFGFELLSAVAPPDDPLIADWQTAATVTDFLENPDAAARGHWRRAQQAVRAQDWQTAVAEMQAIVLSMTRTRQPFRAAYGRAILRNSPDRADEAYPLLHEAALSGDAAARAWVSDEDVRRGRYAAALPLLEARVMDGEEAAIAPLLSIYAMEPAEVPRDPARELGTLEKIVSAPDAPPLALMLLARHYEDKRGTEEARRALACYQRAAERGHEPAWLELARCFLRGIGTKEDPAAAGIWAGKAFAAGEREKSVPLLIELMQRAPDQVAKGIQALFDHQQVAAPAGFADERRQEGGVSKLQMLLARYFDRKGMFAQAARFYAGSGGGDTAATSRLAELTTAHTCEACAGAGKVRSVAPCPTCSGKGTISCGVCAGRGYSLVPGAPPCATCGGTGGMVQNGRAVACATCTGTGKGKASVTKQSCSHCASGRVSCGGCTGGQLKVTKECPSCRGKGSRALVDG